MMAKKLIILLLGLPISLAYADITSNLPYKQHSFDKTRKNIEGLVNAIRLPVADSKLKRKHKFDVKLFNSIYEDNSKQSANIERVLPNLFNLSGDDGFGIRGEPIKSVNMKDKGEIDGANIQFIFKR